MVINFTEDKIKNLKIVLYHLIKKFGGMFVIDQCEFDRDEGEINVERDFRSHSLIFSLSEKFRNEDEVLYIPLEGYFPKFNLLDLDFPYNFNIGGIKVWENICKAKEEGREIKKIVFLVEHEKYLGKFYGINTYFNGEKVKEGKGMKEECKKCREIKDEGSSKDEIRPEKSYKIRESILRIESMVEVTKNILGRIRGTEFEQETYPIQEINSVSDVLNHGPQRMNTALDRIAENLDLITKELF